MKRKPRTPPGYFAKRLQDIKGFLITSGGASIYDIAKHFGLSARTALRHVQALEAAREPLQEERVGHRKVWRLAAATPRSRGFALSQAQLVALTLCKGAFGFLEGTGLSEDLADVFARIDQMLRMQGKQRVEHVARKLFVVTEAPQIYEGKVDIMNDLVTALVREQQLRVRHARINGGKPFFFDPYTLAVYRRGLYLIGYSHQHAATRTLSVDQLVEVDWMRGRSFAYPEGYEPSQVLSPFGFIIGPKVNVRVFFTAQVARLVQRRLWDPSQSIRKVTGGIELTMDLAPTKELVSWVLEWGDQAELLEPITLRARLAEETARAATQYRRAAVALQADLPLADV